MVLLQVQHALLFMAIYVRGFLDTFSLSSIFQHLHHLRNERLTATRAVPEITWLSMLALLDGCEWSNAARWTTHADRQSALAAAA